MGGVDDEVQQFIKRRIDVDQVHARRGHHDIASRHVGHADHAFEHFAALLADDIVVLGFHQGFDQLGFGVRAGVEHFSELLQKAALVFRFGRSTGRNIGHVRAVGSEEAV